MPNAKKSYVAVDKQRVKMVKMRVLCKTAIYYKV